MFGRSSRNERGSSVTNSSSFIFSWPLDPYNRELIGMLSFGLHIAHRALCYYYGKRTELCSVQPPTDLLCDTLESTFLYSTTYYQMLYQNSYFFHFTKRISRFLLPNFKAKKGLRTKDSSSKKSWHLKIDWFCMFCLLVDRFC